MSHPGARVRGMAKSGSVKVRLRFQRGQCGLPPGERMWAVPLRADENGGLYELHNMSLYAPLRIGDVVRAERDGASTLQVVGLEVLEPGPLSYVIYPDESDDVCTIADGWVGRGAIWSEGSPPILATAWREEVPPEQVIRVVAETAPGWEVDEVLDLGERREAAHDVLDLRLDRSTASAFCGCGLPYEQHDG